MRSKICIILVSSFAILASTFVQAIDLADGLVANWTFDGGTLYDYSGNRHAGKAIGSIDFTEGVKGEALKLSGNNYVDVANAMSFPKHNGMDSFSISMWINYQGNMLACTDQSFWATLGVPLSFTVSSKEFVFGSSTQYAVDLICPSHSGWKYAFFMDENNGGYRIYYPSPELPVINNRWYHIVYTMDGGTRQLNTYYNARRGVPDTLEARPLVSYTDAFFVIGGDVSIWTINGKVDKVVYGTGFPGLIDEVRMYDRAISSTEVQALYRKAYTNPEPVKTGNSVISAVGLLLNNDTPVIDK